MLIRKTKTVATDGSGNSSGNDEMPLGVRYARLVKVTITEPSGADADIQIEGADGEVGFLANTVAIPFDKYVVTREDDVVDTRNEAAAANADVSVGPILMTPLTLEVDNGGLNKTYTFELTFEGSFH